MQNHCTLLSLPYDSHDVTCSTNIDIPRHFSTGFNGIIELGTGTSIRGSPLLLTHLFFLTFINMHCDLEELVSICKRQASDLRILATGLRNQVMSGVKRTVVQASMAHMVGP